MYLSIYRILKKIIKYRPRLCKSMTNMTFQINSTSCDTPEAMPPDVSMELNGYCTVC